MYDNGHHYLSSHQTPPTLQSEKLDKVCKSSEIIAESRLNNESKIAFIAPLKSNKEFDETKNNDFSDVCNNDDKISMSSEHKKEDKCLKGTKMAIDSLEITRIELEYKLKEKQQLLEIELLRQRLAATESAMANIISKMDMIPTQPHKVRHFISSFRLLFFQI